MSEEKSALTPDEAEEAPRPEPSAPPQEDESTSTTAPTPTASVEEQSCETGSADVPENSLDEVEPQPPTMFGLVPERCVTFCVDTSGSMFKSLPVVKEHLMETLHSLSRRRDEKAMFNLIEFNSQASTLHFYSMSFKCFVLCFNMISIKAPFVVCSFEKIRPPC